MYAQIINKIDFNKYINYLLIGFAFSIPISKAGANFFEISMLLLWILDGNWKYKYKQYRSNPLIFTFIMFLGYSAVSIFWASSMAEGLDYVLKYRHFLIIFVIFIYLDKKYITHIFSAFLLGIFMSEIMSYGIFFELWTYKNILPSDPSPFMSHTDYSMYLAFASMLLLQKVIENHECIKVKILYILFFLTVTSNLFINGGRTGQVTYVILIFILIFSHIEHKFKAFVLALLLISTTFLVAYNVSPNFHDRFYQAKTDISNMIYDDNFRGSFATRVSLWAIGLETFSDNFLIGTGIGNDMSQVQYYAEKRGYDSEHLKKFKEHDSHNTFITTAIQLGVFGLILILRIYYSLFELKFKTEQYHTLNLIFIILFFLWSFGHIAFHTMNPMVFFALFAGLFNKISQIEQQEEI
ncbi:MAG: O-antigen ligase family protein [Sulfurimonas sp.]|nr:O-antigen ligase family protein [Sulfurimonas sp.]